VRDGAAAHDSPGAHDGAAAQPPVGWLPRGAVELFGEGASAEEAYGLLTVDVPPAVWIRALETARDVLGCTYFDWLSAVDEPGVGFHVSAHVVALGSAPGGPADAGGRGGGSTAGRDRGPAPTAPRRLLVRTTVAHDTPSLPTATGVYAGAAWHERETHEMFGVDFPGHPGLAHLLLPEEFEGHPLRKDFVLAARVVKAWPGAKEPGESDHGGPKRRQMLPPGVPDPNEWGPLKGRVPQGPARPARGARAAATGDRPPRRTRSASQDPASRPAAGAPASPEAQGAGPRRDVPDAPRGEDAGRGERSRLGTPGDLAEPAGPAGRGGDRDEGAEPAGRDGHDDRNGRAGRSDRGKHDERDEQSNSAGGDTA
jgi:NADH:ubiquinone oxidoreductase subunit C